MKTNKWILLILPFLLQSFVSFPTQSKDDFFSIILLPDTQHYSSSYPEIFYAQMDWIKENKDPLNIQYVIQLGDLTNNNKEYAWQVASKSFKILEDAGIPYSIVYGDNDMKNPDKNYYDGIRHTNLLNKYFPVTRFNKPDSWWKGGFFDPTKIDNYYCLFDYKDYKYLIMNLELAPRSIVLNWADSIISANPSRKVLVVTHDYLDRNGKRLNDLNTFGLDGKDKKGKLKGNNAEAVFKKLVKKNPNIILVLCGHKEGEFEKEVKIKSSEDSEKSRKVFEILNDYQDERLKGTDEKSGKGLLRVLKMYPERNEITVSTVSALTGKSKENEVHLFFGKK
ncbi:MAG TPA: metallophosphoesterase [Bacteroidales bacterium]|nr:metallophosphoesterase [Bacteroidales bacterium]